MKRRNPTAKEYAEDVLAEDTHKMDQHGFLGIHGTGGAGLFMGGIPMAMQAETRMNKARSDIAAVKPKIDKAKAQNAALRAKKKGGAK